MNHTYRVVYNETTSTYVAVAEFTPARGKKSKSSKTAQVGRVALTVAALGLAGNALAATVDGYRAGTSSGGTGNIVIGGDNEQPTSQVGASNGNNNTVIGKNAQIKDSGGNVGQGIGSAVAVGAGAQAGNQSIAIGGTSDATTKESITIGTKAVSGKHYGSVVIGTEAKGDELTKNAALGANHVNYDNPLSYLPKKLTYSDGKPVKDNNTILASASGEYVFGKTVAIGYQAQSEGGAVVIGANAIAKVVATDGNQKRGLGVAIGANANSRGGGLAFGSSAITDGINAVAIGRQSAAVGSASQAVGVVSAAKGQGSVAVGHSAYAEGKRSIAIGSADSTEKYDANTNTQAKGENSIAMGSRALANGNNTVAIGSNALVNDNIAMTAEQRNKHYPNYQGWKDFFDKNPSLKTDPKYAANWAWMQSVEKEFMHAAESSVAVGHNAKVLAGAATAKGGYDTLTTGGATAIGHNAQTAFGASVAVGSARANAVNSIAIGAFGIHKGSGRNFAAETRSDGSLAVGNVAFVDTESSGAQAIGRGATVLKDSSGAVALGQSAVAQGAGAVAIGGAAVETAAAVQGVLPRGSSAVAGADKSLALSANSRVYKGSDASIAIGYGSVVGDGAVDQNTDTNIPPSAVTGTTKAVKAVALGAETKVLGSRSAAVGSTNKVTTENTFVLGSGVNMNADGSAALSGTVANSVYLGADSHAVAGAAVGTKNKTSEDAEGTTTTAGNTGTVENATVGGQTYGTFAGKTANGVVTVGAAGSERRIQNVAAGEISATSTDAINGSQLYAVGSNLNNLANTTANALGTTVGADGSLVMPNYKIYSGTATPATAGNNSTPLYTANNVGAALGNLNTYINQGFNVKDNRNNTKGVVTPGESIQFVNSASGLIQSKVEQEANGVTKVSFDVDKSAGLWTVASSDKDGTPSSVISETVALGKTVTFKPSDALVSTAVDANGGDNPIVSIGLNKMNSMALTYDNGKPTGAADQTGTPDLVVTGKKLAEAINNTGFRVQAVQGSGELENGLDKYDPELIKSGYVVQFEAGDNVTLKQDGRKITINAKGGDVKTGTITVNAAGTASANTTAGNLATVDNVAAAINQAGFKVADGAGAKNDLVNAGNTVKFDNGNLTTSEVSTTADGATIKFNVKEGEVAANPAGAADAGKLTQTTDGVVTANNLVTAINSSGFTLKTSANGGTKEAGGADELITPGKAVEVIAGKNLSVKQETNGKITLKTADNVTFADVKTDTLSVGGNHTAGGTATPVVNLKTENATSADVNPTATAPTAALNITAADGKPTQLTGVGSTLNTKNIAINPTPIPGGAGGNATLLDLSSPSKPDSAATVRDLQNMGWVVSTQADGYKDVVKNANEVQFVGKNGINVSGATVGDIRTVTVDVNAQHVVNNAQLPVVYTKADGSKVYPVVDPVTGNITKFNTQPDGKGTDVQPDQVIASMNDGDNKADTPTQLANVKGNLNPTYNVGDKEQGADGKLGTTTAAAATTAATAPPNVESIYNNAATVGDVLNAGFNLQGNGKAVDFVKPYDTVNFADGFGAKVHTKNDDGKTSTIRIDTPMAYINDAGDTVDSSGKPLDSTNAVTLLGKNSNKPVAVRNVASGSGADIPVKGATEALSDQEKTDIIAGINNATGPNLNNAVNVGDLQAVAGQPLTFAGDSGTPVARKLGETLNVKGGATGQLTDNNIGVVADPANGTLTVKLAENINLGDSGSLKFGDNGPVLNKDGINMQGTPITNLKAGAGTQTINTQPNGTAGTATLADFTTAGNVADGNALTVADAKNMGWVVSTKGDGYKDVVKNANEVQFVGKNGATVTGATDAQGIRTITVDVDAQKTAETAQLPVVYTNAKGDKLYKIVDPVSGNVTFNTQPDGKGDTVQPEDVIASMNDGKGNTVNAPTQLANVKGNLNRVDKDGKVTAPDGTQVTAASGDNHKQAPALPSAFDENSGNYDPKVLNNAATMGDVLNAGFNLQGNGDAVDFVKPFDTVNFVNGTGTTVEVKADASGKVNTIKVNTLTSLVDANGAPVVQVGDQFYNAADIDPATGKPLTGKNPIDTTANPIHVNLVNPTAPANATTTTPVQLGNVAAGAGTKDIATKPTGVAGAASTNVKFADLENAPATNVLTVADAKNMGWVVSAGDDYSDAVKNTNEVKFVGKNGATVSGATDAQGVRTITVDVNAQNVANNAQLPVVYTKADGTKVALNPTDNKFYPAKTDGTPDTTQPEVAKGDVIASLNNGDNSSTDPTNLANVKGNLNPTYNKGDMEIVDGKPTATAQTAPTKEQAAPTAAEVAKMYNNAATVGDVLNAGFNLQGNGKAVDFVKPYDTVNFVNGVGTTVNVVAADDGKTSSIQVNGLVGVTDKNGNTLVKANDGKYYKPADVVNGAPKPGAQEVVAGDTVVNLINPNSTDPSKAGDAVQLGNVAAGAGTKDIATKPTGVAGAASTNVKFADLENAPDTNVLTVADAKNMGWVVSAGDDYSDAVKNTNEVKFVGTGLANVTGVTQGDIRTISVHVDAQKVAEAAQLPVVYTDAAGNKLIKGKDAADQDVFYPDNVTLGADGKPTSPADYAKAVQPANVIASMNSGGDSTTAPTQLANVKGNLNPTYNKGDKEQGADGKLGNTTAAAPTKSATAPTDVAKVYNNAATVGDVLNAGFNLQGNGQAVDFVKPYDTVNFVNGVGTTVEVKADANGKVNTIKVNTPMAYVNTTAADQSTPSNTVKMIGAAGSTAPVAVQNVASGVRDTVTPAGTSPTATEIANAVKNASGATLNNAVNVGDLKAVQEGLAAATTQPLTFAGDSGNNVSRQLGQTVKIQGGETDAAKLATGKNIGVVADGSDTLKIQLAKDINLGNDGSVKMGDTTVNNDGLTIANGPSVTKNGIDAGNKVISNVASGSGVAVPVKAAGQGLTAQEKQDIAAGINNATGSALNNAVNIGDLQAVSTNIAGNTTAITAIKNALGDTTKILTYDVKGNTEKHNITVAEAIDNMNKEGIRFFHTNDGTAYTPGTQNNTEDSSASGAYATAIGYQAKATAGSALAVGNSAQASDKSSVAIGHQAKAAAESALAIGSGAQASGKLSIAIGENAQATGKQSISIGTANQVIGDNSGAFGDPSVISGNSAYSVGNHNTIDADDSFAIGNSVSIGANITGAAAIGSRTSVTVDNGVALGTESIADRAAISATKAVNSKIGSTSVGTAYAGNEVYAMKGASAEAQKDVVDTASSTLSAVSVGNATHNRQITGVAAGSLDNDAVNVAQLRSVQSANTTQINQLGNRLNQLGDQIGDVAGGVAQGLATAGLPQAYLPGKSLIAAGVGYFQGHTGYAVGISSISDGGNWIIKGTASGSTRGGFGASAAIGYQW